MSLDNDYLYNKLSGNKSSFFTGEITGSILDTYKYFTDSNPNIFLDINQNLNSFIHSEFNVTLNNVSGSKISANKQKIDSKSGSVEILVVAEVQDYYDNVKTHQNSRYDGSKTISTTYNNYTDGDLSFGKTAAIDKQVKKIGLFTEIISSSYLQRRNNILLTKLEIIDLPHHLILI